MRARCSSVRKNAELGPAPGEVRATPAGGVAAATDGSREEGAAAVQALAASAAATSGARTATRTVADGVPHGRLSVMSLSGTEVGQRSGRRPFEIGLGRVGRGQRVGVLTFGGDQIGPGLEDVERRGAAEPIAHRCDAVLLTRGGEDLIAQIEQLLAARRRRRVGPAHVLVDLRPQITVRGLELPLVVPRLSEVAGGVLEEEDRQWDTEPVLPGDILVRDVRVGRAVVLDDPEEEVRNPVLAEQLGRGMGARLLCAQPGE